MELLVGDAGLSRRSAFGDKVLEVLAEPHSPRVQHTKRAAKKRAKR